MPQERNVWEKQRKGLKASNTSGLRAERTTGGHSTAFCPRRDRVCWDWGQGESVQKLRVSDATVPMKVNEPQGKGTVTEGAAQTFKWQTNLQGV